MRLDVFGPLLLKKQPKSINLMSEYPHYKYCSKYYAKQYRYIQINACFCCVFKEHNQVWFDISVGFIDDNWSCAGNSDAIVLFLIVLISTLYQPCSLCFYPVFFFVHSRDCIGSLYPQIINRISDCVISVQCD